MPHPFFEGSPSARAAALHRLASDAVPFDALDAEALRTCLADAHKLVQRRAAEAAAALARRGDTDIERDLHAALMASDLRLRWGAAYALFLLGPPPRAALPTLLDVIGLDDGDLRWAAADLLKQLAAVDRPLVVRQLLAAARSPGPQRKMALYCLRDLAVGDAFDAALSALGDARAAVRIAALAVLAAVHPDATAAAAHIAALLDDVDPHVQRAAIGTLGGLGVDSEPVRAALDRAESSDDASLRRAAAQVRRRLHRP